MKELSEYIVLLAIVAAAWGLLYVTGYLVEIFIEFFVPKEK